MLEKFRDWIVDHLESFFSRFEEKGKTYPEVWNAAFTRPTIGCYNGNLSY